MTVSGVRILASYESIKISTSMFKVDNFAWLLRMHITVYTA